MPNDIDRILGDYEANRNIWLAERKEFAQSLHDLTESNAHINARIDKLWNRLIGAACVISFISMLLMQIILKYAL